MKSPPLENFWNVAVGHPFQRGYVGGSFLELGTQPN